MGQNCKSILVLHSSLSEDYDILFLADCFESVVTQINKKLIIILIAEHAYESPKR
jgi:hypothetical protein